jgi:hypothetical protein
MAAVKKKPSSKARVATSARERALWKKRSAAARKAAETRARNRAAAEALAKKRSRAAKRAARTRRDAREAAKLAAAQKADRARRSKAGKKGAAKRRAKARAVLALTAMLNAYAAGAPAAVFNQLRPDWHDSKWELYEAVDEDRDAYLSMLEDIAEECDTDWHIAYGPAGED